MTTTALKPAPSAGKLPVAKLPLRQVPNVKTLLVNEQARDQLAAVAAGHMNPERLMRLIANAARTTPKLYECDPMSLLGALMQCASLNLEPNNVLGHAYLIPFDTRRKVKDPETGEEKWLTKTEVQLIIGYRGLITLARRSGELSSIAANVHYSDDELWEYEEGTEATLRHRPGNQEGKKLHAYAVAKFKDGGKANIVLPWAHVMRIRDNSQGWQSAVKLGKQKNSPWFKHEDEMAKKTAIRALAKYLPLSVEFMDAVQIDGARADFAAFATQPLQGVLIDQTADDEETDAPGEQVDPETGEVTQIEDRRGVDQAATAGKRPAPAPDAAPKPAPQRQTRAAKEAPPQNGDDRLPLDDAGREDISVLVNQVRTWIENDMADGSSLQAAIEAYSEQFDIIQRADQQAHDRLMVELEGFDA